VAAGWRSVLWKVSSIESDSQQFYSLHRKQRRRAHKLLAPTMHKKFKFGDFFFFNNNTYAEKRAIDSPENL
jgi:hypothetical protein